MYNSKSEQELANFEILNSNFYKLINKEFAIFIFPFVILFLIVVSKHLFLFFIQAFYIKIIKEAINNVILKLINILLKIKIFVHNVTVDYFSVIYYLF